MREIFDVDHVRTTDDDMMEISDNYICAAILPFYDAMPDGEVAVKQVMNIYEVCNNAGAYSAAVSLTEWIYQVGNTEMPVIIRTILNTPDLHQSFFQNFLESLVDTWRDD